MAEAEALCARKGRRRGRSMACRSRSRTTSTSRDCRPPPPALPSPTRPRRMPPWWRGCARAGAIVIGKTNLDQFATGLVGVRSPYGVPRNAIRRRLIPGGSSSGSAVAVAAGLVPLALGTDTAGSGRVPADAQQHRRAQAKPRPDLDAGVVPACRTLDCVSIFALTTDDAWTALAAIAGPDAADPYSRDRPLGADGARFRRLRLGVPRTGQRSSSATRLRKPPTTRRSRAGPRSARRWSRSTSSRSTRPRGCSMRGHGSRSAIW